MKTTNSTRLDDEQRPTVDGGMSKWVSEWTGGWWQTSKDKCQRNERLVIEETFDGIKIFLTRPLVGCWITGANVTSFLKLLF